MLRNDLSSAALINPTDKTFEMSMKNNSFSEDA